jgi:hypothetical protein
MVNYYVCVSWMSKICKKYKSWKIQRTETKLKIRWKIAMLNEFKMNVYNLCLYTKIDEKNCRR